MSKMRKTTRRITTVLFLALAPLAGLAATPKVASACELCVLPVPPAVNAQCVVVSSGALTCTLDPIHVDRCSQSGVCPKGG